MVSNNSGKFEHVIFSHADSTAEVDENSKLLKDPATGGDGESYEYIPKVPRIDETPKEKLVRYLGEWWWLWLVVGVLYLFRKGA